MTGFEKVFGQVNERKIHLVIYICNLCLTQEVSKFTDNQVSDYSERFQYKLSCSSLNICCESLLEKQ